MNQASMLIAAGLVLAVVYILTLLVQTQASGAFVADSGNFIFAAAIVILAITALLYRKNFK